jgi:hypothetical protein
MANNLATDAGALSGSLAGREGGIGAGTNCHGDGARCVLDATQISANAYLCTESLGDVPHRRKNPTHD